MLKLYRLLLLVVALLSLTACGTVAPKYQPAMDNVQALKTGSRSPVKLGVFAPGGTDKQKVDALTIRGGSFSSPYNGSYAEYLREALRQELYMAGLLDENGPIEVSGVLLQNEIDASGFNTAHAAMEAQLVVRKNGTVRYDKTKSVRHEWESAFAGAVAIPKAHQNYGIVVQKLLNSFYSDAEFKQALK